MELVVMHFSTLLILPHPLQKFLTKPDLFFEMLHTEPLEPGQGLHSFDIGDHGRQGGTRCRITTIRVLPFILFESLKLGFGVGEIVGQDIMLDA